MKTPCRKLPDRKGAILLHLDDTSRTNLVYRKDGNGSVSTDKTTFKNNSKVLILEEEFSPLNMRRLYNNLFLETDLAGGADNIYDNSDSISLFKEFNSHIDSNKLALLCLSDDHKSDSVEENNDEANFVICFPSFIIK